MTVDDVLDAHNELAPEDRKVTLRDLFGVMPEYLVSSDQGTFRQRLAQYAAFKPANKCVHGSFPRACLICFQLGIDN